MLKPFPAMYSLRASLSTLALIILYANYGAGQVAGNNLTAQWKPSPTDKPDFQYNFNVQFTSSCTADQQAAILVTMNNVAGLADRVQLWEGDAFHDWQDEVDYWFGSKSATYDTWIKNNFLRMSTAVKSRKDGWINTWLYISCGPNQGVPALTCNSLNNFFNFNNRYGYFRRWDTIYWNFCPGFWTAPDLISRVKDTTNDPDKNIHYMENYYDTRERWVWPGLLSIRSIGINAMKLDYASRIQSPADCYSLASHPNIAPALVNFMSYYYTAMSISIPEAFNSQARPVIPGDFDFNYFNNLDNSNGSALNLPSTAASPAQESAGMGITNSVSATVDAPPSLTGADTSPFTTISTVSFPTLTDTAHTDTENCFPFLPSISVQGSPTLECDCMTTTAPLTARGSSTSCALSNTLFAINPFRIGAGISGTSISGASIVEPATTAPVTQPPVTSAPPLPTTFSASEAITTLSTAKTSSVLRYCSGNDHSSYLTTSSTNALDSCPYTVTPTARVLPTATPSQLWCAAYYTDSQHCCTVQ